jgi:hypothetical protein
MMARSTGRARDGAHRAGGTNDIGQQAMLSFPNASRSYDATRRCIRFWGHDGAIEISFFMDEGALMGIAPNAPHGESSLLESFDQNRERILVTARKVYERRRKGSYELIASDFR